MKINEEINLVVSHSNFEAGSLPPRDNVNWNGDFQWNEKTIVEDKIDQWRKSKVRRILSI